jgi:hypothetical protein
MTPSRAFDPAAIAPPGATAATAVAQLDAGSPSATPSADLNGLLTSISAAF